MPRLAVTTFGGDATEPGLNGGWEGGPLVTCQNKGTRSRPTLQPEQTCVSRVSVSSGDARRAYMRETTAPREQPNRSDMRTDGPTTGYMTTLRSEK